MRIATGAAGITLIGVTKRYGELAALADCTLSIAPGERVGVVGPRGAGKTTLCRLITGMLSPSAGAVRIFGQCAQEYRSQEGVGYLSEETAAPWNVSVGELLSIRRPSVRGLRLELIVALLGLEPLLDRPLTGIPKAQLRLALAAYAMLGTSGVIVLDEPFAGLDPAAVGRLADSIHACANAGAALIVVSDKLDLLERTSDRVVFLAGGRIHGVLTPGEVMGRGVPDSYRRLLR